MEITTACNSAQSRPDRDAPVYPLPCDTKGKGRAACCVLSDCAAECCCCCRATPAPIFVAPRSSIPHRGGSQPGWEGGPPQAQTSLSQSHHGQTAGHRRRSLLQLRRSCFPETGDGHACVQNGQCYRASPALRQRSHGPDTQGRRDADQNYFQNPAWSLRSWRLQIHRQ